AGVRLLPGQRLAGAVAPARRQLRRYAPGFFLTGLPPGQEADKIWRAAPSRRLPGRAGCGRDLPRAGGAAVKWLKRRGGQGPRARRCGAVPPCAARRTEALRGPLPGTPATGRHQAARFRRRRGARARAPPPPAAAPTWQWPPTATHW